MGTNDKDRSSPAVMVVAAVLMVGFFAWILLQMGPHGPEEGAMLMRLVIALVGGVLIVGAALGIMSLLRRHGGEGER